MLAALLSALVLAVIGKAFVIVLVILVLAVIGAVALIRNIF